jgi:hypothetical protein
MRQRQPERRAHKNKEPTALFSWIPDCRSPRLATSGMTGKRGLQQQLRRMNNAIARCNKVVTELLDFARADSLRYETVVLDDWLGKVLASEAKNLPARIELSYDLGLGDTSATFDTDQMERAIIHLLANACEALLSNREPSADATESPHIRVITKQVSDSPGRLGRIRFVGPRKGPAPALRKRRVMDGRLSSTRTRRAGQHHPMTHACIVRFGRPCASAIRRRPASVGGYGSNGRSFWGNPTREECLSIDIAYLRRHDLLQPAR